MTTLLAAANWLESANGIVVLITGLLGLIGTGIGAFFAVKNFITSLKGKSAKEIWNLIVTVADTAMKEAEASGKTGADKKTQVIETVKAACKAAGVDIDAFADQLNDYIDQTITFVNDMTKNLKK